MATKRPKTLPDFNQPPLNELVLSLQFGQLPFRNYHAGLLWKLYSETYPQVEEQMPIAPVFETFGTPLREQRLQFSLMPVGESSRFWFVSKDGNELFQVQKDRVTHNWRQQNPEDRYPRYENLREKFELEIFTTQQFFRECGLGEILCNQCEVSYINLIPLGDDSASKLGLSDIFTVWAEKYSDTYLRQSEGGQLNVTYIIPSESGSEPLGRLHINATPALLKANNKASIRLALTARGKPVDESIESALNWMDVGRAAAVRAFTSITTKKMHRLWGRKGR